METIKKWRIYAIFLKSNVVQFYMCVKYNGSSHIISALFSVDFYTAPVREKSGHRPKQRRLSATISAQDGGDPAFLKTDFINPKGFPLGV